MTPQELLALPKMVPDDLQWRTHPTHGATSLIETGVLDLHGTTLRGLLLVLLVRHPADAGRTGESWAFRLERSDFGQRTPWKEDLYRLDIRTRPGIGPGHHDAPHAHRLGVRLDLSSPVVWTWREAMLYFCTATNIARPALGHPAHDFYLRP